MAGNISKNTSILLKCIPFGPIPWDSSFFNEAAKVSTIMATSVTTLTMPFTLFFNALIMFVVWKNPSLQVERIIVLAYLALTDFLVGLICQPLFIASEILKLESNEVNCGLKIAFFLAVSLFKGAGFYQVAVISYERYVAIIHPYQYPTRITVKRLTCATIRLWTFNAVIFLILFLTLVLGVSLYINVLRVILRFGISVCIVYFYVRIFAAIRRQKRQQNVNMNSQRTLQNHKGAITAALLLGSILLAIIPFFIIIILNLVFGLSFEHNSAWLIFLQWTETFLIFTSLLNAIIYGLRTREVREKCREALGFLRNNDEGFSHNAFVLQPIHVHHH